MSSTLAFAAARAPTARLARRDAEPRRAALSAADRARAFPARATTSAAGIPSARGFEGPRTPATTRRSRNPSAGSIPPGASGETSGETSGASREHARSRLVLYTKPGCCLCEGLAEKLEEVMSTRAGGAMGDVLRAMRLETRDVSARADWADAHATEVPVVTLLVAAAAGKDDHGGNDREGAPPREVPLPRPAPRLSAARLAVRLGQDVQSALSPGGGDGARARTGWAAPRRKKSAGGSNEANGGWTVVSERPF